MSTSGVSSLWDLMPDDLGGVNVIKTETMCTKNVMHLNHPKTIPPTPTGTLKTCLPRNHFLVPRRLGTTHLHYSLLATDTKC